LAVAAAVLIIATREIVIAWHRKGFGLFSV
jgi:hypothetical protein